ncbi:MAG: DNA-3-methyladenine glycosylase [Dehalococcoidia bacterium]|nr:DNA-3-methyladenine glycosylase [Dehalococcoidia bacterium]
MTDDIERILAHLRQDSALAPIIDRVGAPTLTKETDPDRLFFRLVEAIISQQLHASAAQANVRRLEAVVPGGRVTPTAVRALEPDQLRGIGLSNAKIRSLLDLASRIVDGMLDLRNIDALADDVIIHRLTQVRGIGRWTADMFLIFALRRPDVLPTGDFGVRAAMRTVYDLPAMPDKATMERIAEPWRPYRTYGSWYLWRSLDKTPMFAR